MTLFEYAKFKVPQKYMYGIIKLSLEVDDIYESEKIGKKEMIGKYRSPSVKHRMPSVVAIMASGKIRFLPLAGVMVTTSIRIVPDVFQKAS